MNERVEGETAVFGGGCFWCTEAVFADLKGILSVLPGYSGGHVEQPTYQEVCADTTGHAEVVQVRFDPDEVSYRELVEIFFATHDPTTIDRQGHDVGSQYRSVVFYENDEQRRVAQEVIEELEREGIYNDPIVTQVAPLDRFWEAEPYHRNFYRNNPGQAYCNAVIAPKMAKFRQKYAERLRG